MIIPDNHWTVADFLKATEGMTFGDRIELITSSRYPDRFARDFCGVFNYGGEYGLLYKDRISSSEPIQYSPYYEFRSITLLYKGRTDHLKELPRELQCYRISSIDRYIEWLDKNVPAGIGRPISPEYLKWLKKNEKHYFNNLTETEEV